MAQGNRGRGSILSGLLIAPDRALAEQFSAASASLNAFEVLADIKSYPTEQTVGIRLRQLDPDVVLLDVASNLDRALELIAHLTRVSFGVSVVALDRKTDSEAILRILRTGASEYLHAPFDDTNMREAVARLLRLRKPDPARDGELGAVIAFSSVKPGSGASTLALQTAFALKRTTGRRVLLVDLDLTGGTVGFYLKLDLLSSIADAVAQSDRLTPALWSSLAGKCEGVDVLPAPAMPVDEFVDPAKLQTVLDYARTIYDWVVVDLPIVPQRTTLITMSQADRTFLISTAELPSLHLARRAVDTLNRLGFPKERCQFVINRVDARSRMKIPELEKLLRCSVQGTLPNDYFSLHRVVTLGQSLEGDGPLGRAIERLAGHAVEVASSLKKLTEAAAADAAPAYSVS